MNDNSREGFDEYHLFFHLLQVSFHQTQCREQLDNNIFHYQLSLIFNQMNKIFSPEDGLYH